jgi:hypothetical protein
MHMKTVRERIRPGPTAGSGAAGKRNAERNKGEKRQRSQNDQHRASFYHLLILPSFLFSLFQPSTAAL